MYIDDLPVWGIVGEIGDDGTSFYIWTHKKFDVGYNNNQIVDVNLTSEFKVLFTCRFTGFRGSRVAPLGRTQRGKKWLGGNGKRVIFLSSSSTLYHVISLAKP